MTTTTTTDLYKKKKKKCRGGIQVWLRKTLMKDRPEGVSRNSLKTGQKHGRISREAMQKRREENADRINAAREKAESLAKQETYLVVAAPGELVKCQNNRKAMHTKLLKYDHDEEKYICMSEGTSFSIPCPPVFIDANTDRVYIADIAKEKIFCSIKPLFLIRKFVNVLSSRYAQTLRQRWTRFMDTKPKAHNTDEDSSARSSHVKSYHLGIWRRSNKEARITKDTCIKTRTRRQRIGREQCLNFMRTVQRAIAPVVRRLMKRYMPDEWKERKRMAKYIKATRIIAGTPELDFGGAFTTVAVTNGVGDIAHTDRNDAGVTWLLPLGEFEGADTCFTQLTTRIPLKEGDALAFQANFLAHKASPLLRGDRLALTCFTDKNIMRDSQKLMKRWKKSIFNGTGSRHRTLALRAIK